MPLVWTPSAVAAEIDRVRSTALTLDREIEASRTGSPAFRVAWRNFYDEISRWLDSEPSTLWGGNAVMADAYLERIAVWRQEFEAQGGASAAPSDEMKDGEAPIFSRDPTKPSPLSDALKSLAWIAGALAVVYLASKVPAGAGARASGGARRALSKVARGLRRG